MVQPIALIVLLRSLYMAGLLWASDGHGLVFLDLSYTASKYLLAFIESSV
jgi:hypothetical protein